MRPPAAAVIAAWLAMPAAILAQPAPGSPDVGFGTGGTVWTLLPPGLESYRAEAVDVAVDGAGRIVVVGYTSESSASHPEGHLAVLRYLPNGELDATFGGDGIVTTPIGPSTNGRATAVAIQPDGRILVAGMVHAAAESQYHFDPVLVRYRPDGSLDPMFGAAGVVVTPIDNPIWILGMALQPDGRIVVAGTLYWTDTGNDPLVLRYHPSGFLDDTFGVSGVVRLSLNGHQQVTDVALTSTGRILLIADADGDALLARLRADGELDDTFNGDGLVVTPGGPRAGVVVQPDRKIVVPGTLDPGFGGYRKMAVARHEPSGSLDAVFGNGGIAALTSPAGAEDAVVQPNGRIVLAGSYAGAAPLLRRVEADGSPDPSFQFDLSAPLTGSVFNAVALQSDGKLVAVGRVGDPPRGILVSRFHGDPPDVIFEDGFDSGDTSAWSSTAPPNVVVDAASSKADDSRFRVWGEP